MRLFNILFLSLLFFTLNGFAPRPPAPPSCTVVNVRTPEAAPEATEEHVYGEVDVRVRNDEYARFSYRSEGDIVVAEGDMILGTLDEIQGARGSGIHAVGRKWAAGVVPCEITGNFSNMQQVWDAIAHWKANTNIRLVPRNGERNFVRFARDPAAAACYSYVGMTGQGMQPIRLNPSCGTAEIIHEIGHAIGLFHEHTRTDRDQFLTVFWDRVRPEFKYAFNVNGADSANIGPYDVNSIMHYGRTAFSKDGLPTMESKIPGKPIRLGNGQVLSPGDKNAVKAIYW